MHNFTTFCSKCDCPLEVAEEDGDLIFTCQKCGYKKLETNHFRFDGWYLEAVQAFALIDILRSLLTNGDTVEFIRPRLQGVSHLVRYRDHNDEYLFGELSIAYQAYLRQIIVLAVTYIELILKEFYKCWFRAKPERMNSYLALPQEKGNASVKINEFLSTSKEELLTKLIDRAVSKVADSKIDTIVENIIKDCRLETDISIIKELQALKRLRNQIVHGDPKIESVSVEQAYNSFRLVSHLLNILEKAAEEYRIPYLKEVDWSSSPV